MTIMVIRLASGNNSSRRRLFGSSSKTSFLLLVCLPCTILLCLGMLHAIIPSSSFLSADLISRNNNKPIFTSYHPQIKAQEPQMLERDSLKLRFLLDSRNSSSGRRETKKTLCVLLTTFKSSPLRWDIQQNTLVNWAALRPYVQPVLFLERDTEVYRRRAEALGWHVYEVPRTNRHGTPHLADMVDVIMNTSRYDAIFYGFANSDIFFDNWLLATLMSLVEHWGNDVSMMSQTAQPIMLTGRRTNYKLNTSDKSNSSVSKLPLADFSRVAQMHKHGTLFASNAEDYFFFTRTIPRRLFIRELIFGRPGYDNYLVAMAAKKGVTMVDITQTVRAVHVQVGEGEWEQAGFNNTDAMHNLRVIGITGHFDFAAGETSRIRYETIIKRRTSDDDDDGDGIILDDRWQIVVRDRSTTNVG